MRLIARKACIGLQSSSWPIFFGCNLIVFTYFSAFDKWSEVSFEMHKCTQSSLHDVCPHVVTTLGSKLPDPEPNCWPRKETWLSHSKSLKLFLSFISDCWKETTHGKAGSAVDREHSSRTQRYELFCKKNKTPALISCHGGYSTFRWCFSNLVHNMLSLFSGYIVFPSAIPMTYCPMQCFKLK